MAVPSFELDRMNRARGFHQPAVVAEQTLDEVLVHAWHTLITERPAACPWCGDDMHPDYAAQARAIGGRCDACGTRLT